MSCSLDEFKLALQRKTQFEVMLALVERAYAAGWTQGCAPGFHGTLTLPDGSPAYKPHWNASKMKQLFDTDGDKP